MDTTSAGKVGFVYTVEQVRAGEVIHTETVHNLVPDEGIEYLLRGALLSGTPIVAWYIGIYEGDYVPTPDVTAVNVASASVECSAYTSTSRPAWTGAYTAGTADNSASRAEFTMNLDKSVYGAFLISNASKGSNTGTLLSIARFTSPKNLESADILRITAGLSLLSA